MAFPEHCNDQMCLCSGGKHVMCMRGKEINEANRNLLLGLVAGKSKAMAHVVGPIYVASSWRNAVYPGVVQSLRDAGLSCYDFRNPLDGECGFSWRQTGADEDYVNGDTWLPERIVETLEHPAALRGFELDFGAMRDARACVLVMPCGRSAHIEAGYFVGAGRPLHVLLTAPAEPELMWRLAYESGGAIHITIESVIKALVEE